MRRLTMLLGVLCLLFGLGVTPVQAQPNPLQGPQLITVVDAGACVTAGACATFPMNNFMVGAVEVSGTFTGTLTPEILVNSVWAPVTLYDATGTPFTTITVPGAYSLANTGFARVRLRAGAFAAGTATVVLRQGYFMAKVVPKGQTTLFADGLVTAPAMAFASEPGFGWYRAGPSKMALAGNSGKTLFFIDTDGSVGLSNSAVNGGNAVSVFQLDGSSFFRINANINSGGKFAAYNSVSTAGWGAPAIYAAGRFTAQTAAKASVAAYTVGAADGSFEVSCNVLVTVATTHSFGCSVSFTDEGSTARTIFLDFASTAGFPGGAAAIVNANGAIPYMGTVRSLRAKAATAITIQTSGTFTTVTYNVEGFIKQIS